MAGSATGLALPSLALFCATALAHRHLTLRHECEITRNGTAGERRRRKYYRSSGSSSCRSSVSLSPSTIDDAHDADDEHHDEHRQVHLVRLRKRVSFDGLPSDHFPQNPDRIGGDFGRKRQQQKQEVDADSVNVFGEERYGRATSGSTNAPSGRYDEQGTCISTKWPNPTEIHPAHGNWSHFDLHSEESRRRLGLFAAEKTAAATTMPPGRRRAHWSEDDQSSFVIYGGDEMDDDEAGGGRGGVLTSAGAAAMRSQGPPWRVGGLLKRLSSVGGASFFADADDAASYPGDGDEQQQQQQQPSLSIPVPVPSSSRRRSTSEPGPPHSESSQHESSLPNTKDAPKRSYLRMESARADYNAKIMPSKVVMVRHGQSEGNVEEAMYATTPDNAMKLTKLGWDQARMAGKELKERILPKGESVHFVVSPYVRTVETFHGIVSAWCDPSEFDHIEDRDQKVKAWYGRLMEMGLTWHEDPRIREQDFGNYQDPVAMKKSKRERHGFGTFYYRFPHGESASDVFDRASTFLDSLWRSFDLKRSQNYVLVTHGISIRVLLARYFRYSIDQFNMLANPKNCDMVMLAHDGEGKLRLEGRCELKTISSENKDGSREVNRASSSKKIVGYKFHDRLRILPREYITKREIRLSFDD